MTTKQEIIEFIGDEDHGLIGACANYETHTHELPDWSKLIHMIKDLKPEIKVKGLVWNGYSNNSGKYDLIYDEYSKDEPFYRINQWFYGVETDEELAKRRTFQEAQHYIQNLWDEYVLSLVEVNDEN